MQEFELKPEFYFEFWNFLSVTNGYYSKPWINLALQNSQKVIDVIESCEYRKILVDDNKIISACIVKNEGNKLFGWELGGIKGYDTKKWQISWLREVFDAFPRAEYLYSYIPNNKKNLRVWLRLARLNYGFEIIEDVNRKIIKLTPQKFHHKLNGQN